MADYSSLNDATLQTLISARGIPCASKTRDNMVAALVGYDSQNNTAGGMSIGDFVLLGKFKRVKAVKAEGEEAGKAGQVKAKPKPKAAAAKGKAKKVAKKPAKGKGKAKGNKSKAESAPGPISGSLPLPLPVPA